MPKRAVRAGWHEPSGGSDRYTGPTGDADGDEAGADGNEVLLARACPGDDQRHGEHGQRTQTLQPNLDVF
jgi:hypothetical protein